VSVGRESLALLIDDPGPCPICDGDDCTHTFYGDQHYRIGDGKAKRKAKVAAAIAATQDLEQAPRPPSRKGRRARPASTGADSGTGATTPAGEGPTCSSPPPTTAS